MGTIKTLVNDDSVLDFINAVESDVRRRDGLALYEMFGRVTGLEPKMWGPSMIGYGMYHYKSEKSRQEGDWPLTGFSPRKQNLTLNIMHGLEPHADKLAKLGKYKTGMGCLYINKLADVNMGALEELITISFNQAKKKLA
jgi:hypothetical protein